MVKNYHTRVMNSPNSHTDRAGNASLHWSSHVGSFSPPLLPSLPIICSSLHLSLIRFHHRVHIRRQKIKSLDNIIYPYFVQQL
jgi:hypothetical protein